MKLNDKTIYQSLTPEQRVAAAISATARDDKDELQRLKVTCPMRNVRETDERYAGIMLKLMNLSMFLECDIRGIAMNDLLNRLNGTGEEITRDHIMEIASRLSAWRQFAEERGIDADEMEQAGMPRHSYIDSLMKGFREAYGEEFAEEFEDPATIAEFLTLFRQYIEG